MTAFPHVRYYVHMADASRTLSMTEARKRFFELADDVQVPGVHYTLTEKGRPRVVMMSPEEYEGLVETLDILSEDPKILEKLTASEKEIKQGKYVTLEELEKEYGISSHPRTKSKKRVR